MKQRVFSFYAFLPEPRSMDISVVALCKSEADAIDSSLKMCKEWEWHDGRMRDAKVFAKLINKSESYISRIRRGERPMPKWMVEAFCRFTGSRLVKQYRDLQEAMQTGEDTDNARRQAIAECMRMAFEQADRRAA